MSLRSLVSYSEVIGVIEDFDVVAEVVLSSGSFRVFECILPWAAAAWTAIISF